MLLVREIAGWLLVLIAIYLIRIAVVFVTDLESPRVLEAGVIVLGALGILRAGILLVRMATAARICS
jgi:hypothetical protein